ncbi:Fe-S cluster assembly protein SufD [Moorena producens PAL-8-15-08-1]|uniref:Fe-S cluster assembly protein SufD n=1 Tax=Moorena producens PAL-8-15-08-1 TaxID=1458985 RepID=A0A1D8TSC0_9CYAN|nr:Fe-S cluster assembly protein SufD [Moorena producens]AOX00484.1 Fe-S cluster assembly protein SufD [Moorena producens PAL-8-15-08-1]
MTMEVSVKREVSYLSALLEQCRQDNPVEMDWLQELSNHARGIAQELAIPTTKDEEWRFTDLSPLLQETFEAAVAVDTSTLDISPVVLPEAINSRLVFVNGIYAPELSSVAGLPEGVFVGNLAELPSEYQSRIADYLGKQQGATDVFTLLNTAGLTDVAVIWLPRNTEVTVPIHLLFVSMADGVPRLFQPRCLVVAEAGSQLSLVEEYWQGQEENSAQGVYLTNSVTEVWVGENARVTHIRVDGESNQAFHVGKSAIAQARNSFYSCHGVAFGGKLSRHTLEVFQMGEGTETILNGLTAISEQQLADTHSAVMLNHPNGISDQLQKCIIDGSAHAVFNGKVSVPQPAQLTNAAQLNRNLLLSPKARVDTKPQLEITADNVKCSHGATVSQLEADEVFYLQSRGLKETDARNLLIDAFVAEILNQIPLASLRQRLSEIVISSKRERNNVQQ